MFYIFREIRSKKKYVLKKNCNKKKLNLPSKKTNRNEIDLKGTVGSMRNEPLIIMFCLFPLMNYNAHADRHV